MWDFPHSSNLATRSISVSLSSYIVLSVLFLFGSQIACPTSAYHRTAVPHARRCRSRYSLGTEKTAPQTIVVSSTLILHIASKRLPGPVSASVRIIDASCSVGRVQNDHASSAQNGTSNGTPKYRLSSLRSGRSTMIARMPLLKLIEYAPGGISGRVKYPPAMYTYAKYPPIETTNTARIRLPHLDIPIPVPLARHLVMGHDH